jgi:cobalt-precorrin-5B (C1)-methyltransferase
LSTPAEILLRLRPIHCKVGPHFAECAIRKYSGDDPDVTNGCEVHVRVERAHIPYLKNREEPEKKERQGELRFIGGDGVGLVTRPGLQIAQGEPAINPVPRQMIRKEIADILGDCEGVVVKVSVPGGEALAKKTFNERLGIMGGYQLLGCPVL